MLEQEHHHRCGKHQVWSPAAGCDPTCWEPYGTRKCPLILRPGCVCKRGYVRRGKHGKGRCVRLKKCFHCPKHEKRTLCRGHCQPTCKNHFPKCSLKCRRGCRCRLGYVRSRPG
ncbi:cysteine rich trypsin inhibitor-like protein 12, partial [Sarcoptes scabiei]